MAKKTSGFTSEELGPQTNTNIWVCAAYLKMITRGPGFSHWIKFSTGPPMSSPPALTQIGKTNPKKAIPAEHGPYQNLGLFGSLARGSTTRQPKHPKHRVIAACTRASLLLSCLRRQSELLTKSWQVRMFSLNYTTIRTTPQVIAGQSIVSKKEKVPLELLVRLPEKLGTPIHKSLEFQFGANF